MTDLGVENYTLLLDALDNLTPDTTVGIVRGREDGGVDVAVKYYRQGRQIVKCRTSEYLFLTQANICMSWIPEDDVQCILNKRGGCCGQQRPGVYSLANAADVRRWTNKGGR